MGSTRKYDVSAIVGKNRNLTPQKIRVTKAIKSGIEKDIAFQSARLVEKSELSGSYFFYGKKLLGFLEDFKTQSEKISATEIDKILRKEWSIIKRRDKISDNPVLDDLVLDSAKVALRRGKK